MQRSYHRKVRVRGTGTLFEPLERRALLSASPLAELVQPMATPMATVTSTHPYGYTPAQVKQAYGFANYVFPGTPGTPGTTGTPVAGTGSGQTIAIVDAYNDPNIAGDLHIFDQQFGLADPTLTIQKMSSNVATDAGWAMEISLDVEWAHAIAPGAKILLVEATSSNMGDLLNAVNYARNQAGVSTVSMSWGGSEFSGETAYDTYFTTPSTHVGGITFVASAGDDGAPPEYPSASPNVVSVGGTNLKISSTGSYLGETGWNLTKNGGGGGGISAFEGKPEYQSSVTQSATMRTTPDISYDADPSTGVAVYDSVAYSGQSGWFEIGGTSAGAPQIAAMIAIVDQGRALAGKSSLDGVTQTLPTLYTMSSADFHDIVSGNNGYSAGTGYDLVTGRGSPVANLAISNLVQSTTTVKLTQVAPPSNNTGHNTSRTPARKSGRDFVFNTEDQDNDLFGNKKSQNPWDRSFDLASVRLVEVIL